jgi:LPXTG-motif cell wall-anchored protein
LKNSIKAGILATALVSPMFLSGTAWATQPEFICNEGAGWEDKVDTDGDPATVEYIAPDGFLVDAYCVKAGTTKEIVELDPDAASVVIDHSVKDSVSHYQVKLVAIPPAEEPPAEEPPAEEPPAEEPPAEEPPAEEPPAEEPPAEEPPAEEPPAEEPPAEEPPAEEPVTEEPVTEEPVTEEPVVVEPPVKAPNCDQLWPLVNIPLGSVFYFEGNDRDKDGVACEENVPTFEPLPATGANSTAGWVSGSAAAALLLGTGAVMYARRRNTEM